MPLEPKPPTWRRLLPYGVLLLAAVAPYLGVLDAPYVFDDVKLVQENKLLRTPLPGWREVLETFDITSRKWDAEELRPNYRPLRFVSYLLDAKLSELCFGPTGGAGPPVFFFHLTNVLLHAVCSLLVFALARSLWRDVLRGEKALEAQAGFFGFAAALLFAVHPLQTEAVTYISGRRDVLSAAFFLAAAVLHARSDPDGPPRWGTSILVFASFGLGLLAKETLVTLPPALLLLDLVRRARWGTGRVCFHLPAFAITGGFVWITLSNVRLMASAAAGANENVLATACRYTARYLGLLLFPASQSADYSFDAITPSTSWLEPWTTLPTALLCAALLITVGAILIRPPPARRWLLVLPLGLFWLVGTLTPVLQFVPIAEKFAERFAYVPSVGLCLILALAAVRLGSREQLLAWGAVGVAAVALFALTVRRNADWETPIALWESAVKAQPRAARAHLALANALKDGRLYREAAEEYSRAIAIFEEKPDVPLHHGFLLQALSFRAGVLGLLGERDPERTEKAVADYRRVLRLRDVDGVEIESSPRHVVLHFDLAGLLLRQGDLEAAEREYHRAIEIAPRSPIASGAHYYLSRVARARGQTSRAVESLERALELAPVSDPAWLTMTAELADLLIETKDLDAAASLIVRALEASPAPKARHILLLREAKVLDRKGDLAGCIARLERILAEDPNHGPALLTLARIETAQSRLDRAEARYRSVLALEPSNAEALEGIQTVALLRRVNEGKGREPGKEDPTALLEAMEKKGLEAIAKGEILAAREIYTKLCLRATEAGLLPFQLASLRALARVEESLGHYRKSEEHLKTALALDGRDSKALRQLADLYLQRFDDRGQARTHYERSIGALPRGETADPLVHFNLAELIGSEDPQTALAHLEQARKAGYSEPALDRAMGYRLAELSRFQESLDAFNRYFDRTTVLDAQGREDLARKRAKEFVKSSVIDHVRE